MSSYLVIKYYNKYDNKLEEESVQGIYRDVFRNSICMNESLIHQNLYDDFFEINKSKKVTESELNIILNGMVYELLNWNKDNSENSVKEFQGIYQFISYIYWKFRMCYDISYCTFDIE